MKTNKSPESPEKVYVQLPSRKWIGKTWNETPIKEGDSPNWKNATNIEYTRTDAFIEKACKWLQDHTELCITDEDGNLYQEFINDFKQAMEK